MNILLLGSGGREHALAWAIDRSATVDRLFVAPGNAGIAKLAKCIDLDPMEFDAVVDFCRMEGVDLVVVGPEAPLIAGLVDRLESEDIRAFGPTAAAARLEGSKAFTKDLCTEYGIPTAAYARFDDEGAALAYVREQPLPLVVKADGIAAGKGVIIAETLSEAENAVREMFAGRFGAAGETVVIEEFLVGEEASFFALTDGKTAMALAGAQDHKRVGDGDTGPNTGGMGAYSPAPVLDDAMRARVMREIIEPTIKAMADKDCPFKGVLYAGLMITEAGPKLIEYNVRFGDPECQVLMVRILNDIVPVLKAVPDGQLDNVSLGWDARAALTVVMASKGYPEGYEKGTPIAHVPADGEDLVVFHAGTATRNGALVATGGRVLNVTGLGATVGDAQHTAYEAVDQVQWPGGFARRDIGYRAVARERGES